VLWALYERRIRVLLEELEFQLEITLKALSKQYASNPENILKSYINKYERALNHVRCTTMEDIDTSHLKRLLSLARGYMETSSNYSQSFLNEMGKSEKLISAIV
jgi:hypothetical protein